MSEREDFRKQWKGLAGKGFRAHVEWLWLYYKWYAIVGIIALFLVGSVVKTFVTAKPAAVNAVLINADLPGENEGTTIAEGFAQAAGIDLRRKEIRLDMSSSLTPGLQFTSYDQAIIQRLAVYGQSGDLDVVAADTSIYSYLVNVGTVIDLRLALTEEQLSEWEEDLYYVDLAEVEEFQQELEDSSYVMPTQPAEEAREAERIGTYVRPDPSQMEEPVPVGIFITDSEIVKQEGLYEATECVIGIGAGGKRRETAARFLEWMYTGQIEA